MRFQRWTALKMMVCIVLLSTVIRAQGNVFQTGASISEITPFLGSSIVGGYNSLSASYIHDPLNVRTLVVDYGHKQLIIARENALMSAKNTHSGVGLNSGGTELRDYQNEISIYTFPRPEVNVEL